MQFEFADRLHRGQSAARVSHVVRVNVGGLPVDQHFQCAAAGTANGELLLGVNRRRQINIAESTAFIAVDEVGKVALQLFLHRRSHAGRVGLKNHGPRLNRYLFGDIAYLQHHVHRAGC